MRKGTGKTVAGKSLVALAALRVAVDISRGAKAAERGKSLAETCDNEDELVAVLVAELKWVDLLRSHGPELLRLVEAAVEAERAVRA